MNDVRILVRSDPTLEHYTVPADQIPPGYIKIHMKEHGEFYASLEWLAKAQDAGHRHAEFPDTVRDIFREFIQVFLGVYDRTLEEWEDGFRKDQYPWHEIATWQWYSDAIKRFTSHLSKEPYDQQKRRDVFKVVMAMDNQPPEVIEAIKNGKAQLGNTGSVMAKRVREIAKWMYSDANRKLLQERSETLRKLLKGPGLAGPERVPLNALLDASGIGLNRDADFNPGDLLNSADSILAVDIDSNHEALVYGRDFMEQIARTGISRNAAVLRVDIDMDTDDLERLIALVQVIRGRHDYKGRGETRA